MQLAALSAPLRMPENVCLEVQEDPIEVEDAA